MKITFLGATETVTGSKYLIETDKTKILVDCGLFQGFKELRERNWSSLPIDPQELNAIILTHAHIDHSGYIPVLVRKGFSGPIYCSSSTKKLCEILLPDSGYLQEEEARFRNKHKASRHKPALPLYTVGDAEYALKYFRTVSCTTYHDINGGDIRFKLVPAGHILGAAFIKLQIEGKTIVFSGDIGRMRDPIMYTPFNLGETNYLVLESTYGDRLHENVYVEGELEKMINTTVKKGGVVIIPAFAVGRTQLILYYLYQLRKTNRIPNIPIYVDSPMATNASHIFRNCFKEHRLSKEEADAVFSIAEYVNTRDDSKKLDEEIFPKIILSASGMAEGGRVLHHLMRFLPDKRNTVIFTGYQSDGTKGDQLIKGKKQLRLFGQETTVKAKIRVLENLSAHADYNGILTWLETLTTTPETVFITHGNIASTQSLKTKIEKKFKWNCVIPKYRQSFVIATEN